MTREDQQLASVLLLRNWQKTAMSRKELIDKIRRERDFWSRAYDEHTEEPLATTTQGE